MTLPRRLSEPGPLIEYIAQLQTLDKRKAQIVIDAVRESLMSPSGSILLNLLDKAILERSIPISSDPRALDANNAQSFIALDLRRILSDEFDAALEDKKADMGTSRRGRTRA